MNAAARFHCCDAHRLEVLARAGTANAIRFIEVLDRAAPPGVPRQRTLLLRLLRDGFSLAPHNLRIDGGERIARVGVQWCAAADALPPEAEPGLADGIDAPSRTLVIRTDGSGDFSRYRLSLVADAGSDDAPAGFDPRLSSIDFSFKVECAADFDCAESAACPPEAADAPEIDYLAKDYEGFRRLLLDRLSLRVPGWTERSAADIGVTLVELLAYAADNLSYRQDAIATEAYLGTARQRISVRRHARLVDYALHEGCNARAFVQLQVRGHGIALPRGTPLLTRVPRSAVVLAPDSDAWRAALASGPTVFETAHDARLDERLNRLDFYTWGDQGCCLPRGSTHATLRGHADLLRPGDLLVLRERLDPDSLRPEDADRTHRWPVRITRCVLADDPSGQLFDDPPVDGPVPVTEIDWDAADALPFALCLSVSARPGLAVSEVLGNIVLADHGRSVRGEALGTVPEPHLRLALPGAADGCAPPPVEWLAPRFRPRLAEGPLTHGFDLALLMAQPIGGDAAGWPARALLGIDPRAATPRIQALLGQPSASGAMPEAWHVRRDLLDSAADDAHAVAEVDDAGRAQLRFGDDRHGRRPLPGTRFTADYRVGNGAAGNVGADTIAHVASALADAIVAVHNPLPATGGIDAEDLEAARRDAPEAFRRQERAVTPADYARAAERRPDIQRAAASFRWTGSWHTVFVTPDRFGGLPVDAPFAGRLRHHLERFRMAGYDLQVRPPRYVALDVALHLCVNPAYFRADVLRHVARVLSSAVLPDGRLGLFHPDRLSFGQAVYLSPLVAAAQAVAGVDSVRVIRFERLGERGGRSRVDGMIPIGALEIAQLANDPNFPERGRLQLDAGGGL